MPLPQSGCHIKRALHFLLQLLPGAGLRILDAAAGSLFRCSLLPSARAVRLAVDDIVVAELIDAVQRTGAQQNEQIQGMEMIAVLVLHQKVHGHGAEEHGERYVAPAARPSDEEGCAQGSKRNDDHIVIVVEIPHAVQEILPLLGQCTLLIHEQQIPGGAVVVVGPEYGIFVEEEIQYALSRRL